MKGILESKSLWYKYKTMVWLDATSSHIAVVHNIMRTLRSVYYPDGLAYISVPITSGKFLYDLWLQHPSMEHRERIRRTISHNYEKGWNFLQDVRRRKECPVVNPADLTPIHQEWEQTHFQALWLSIIAEQCTEMHMSDGWEYSSGGSEEFTHVMQLRLGIPKHDSLFFWNTREGEDAARERMRNITVYDHTGKTLSLNDGIYLIESALAWLDEHEFARVHGCASSMQRIRECLRLLRWTGGMIEKGFYQ